mmetsp:Transcript_44702/g.95246  ORF Transcript_44702/g.95246 Transcript_44702/m.95246 type:complete len:232 (-) Transcript_44702:2707-3402(-)
MATGEAHARCSIRVAIVAGAVAVAAHDVTFTASVLLFGCGGFTLGPTAACGLGLGLGRDLNLLLGSRLWLSLLGHCLHGSLILFVAGRFLVRLHLLIVLCLYLCGLVLPYFLLLRFQFSPVLTDLLPDDAKRLGAQFFGHFWSLFRHEHEVGACRPLRLLGCIRATQEALPGLLQTGLLLGLLLQAQVLLTIGTLLELDHRLLELGGRFLCLRKVLFLPFGPQVAPCLGSL